MTDEKLTELTRQLDALDAKAETTDAATKALEADVVRVKESVAHTTDKAEWVQRVLVSRH